MFRRIALTAALIVVAACRPQESAAPATTIGGGGPTHPVVGYMCGETKLVVQQLGESVSVSVNGAAPIALRQTSSTSDRVVYSNGRQTLTVQAGQLAWAAGRASSVKCVGG